MNARFVFDCYHAGSFVLACLAASTYNIGLLGLGFIRRVAVVFDEIVVTVVWIAV